MATEQPVEHYELLPGVTDEGTVLVLDAESEAYEKRLANVAKCGTWLHSINPLTGLYRSIMLHCDDYELCDLCRKVHENDIIARVANLADPNLRCLFTPRADWSVIKDQIGTKDDYLRLPQVDGTDLVIFISSDKSLGEPTNAPELLQVFDWNEIARTPKGSRVSGALGKDSNGSVAVKDETSEDECIVNIATYHITDEAGQEIGGAANRAIQLETIQATVDLDPKTGEELAHALHIRQDLYSKKLTESGYKYEIQYRREKIIPYKCNWGINSGIILQRKAVTDAKYHADKRTVPQNSPRWVYLGLTKEQYMAQHAPKTT